MKKHYRKVALVTTIAVQIPFINFAHAIAVTQSTDANLLLNQLMSQNNSSGYDPVITGANSAIGYYNNLSNLYGIGSGIALSSGKVSDYSDGPNTVPNNSTSYGTDGSADLTSLSGNPTHDAASFSFDFQASSSNISFDFAFGSEEYAEYVGSSFNDAFGVYLTDSSGNKTQVSTDNNGNPITINTAWMSPLQGNELDGSTGMLTTEVSVVKGQNYNIEFALADAGDSVYDSTVFVSNFEGSIASDNPIDIYGLFIGVDDNNGFSGQNDAHALKNAFEDNLGNVGSIHVEEVDYNNNTLSDNDVGDLIDQVMANVDDNDLFVFYFSGHGGSVAPNTQAGTDDGENTLNVSDEIISLGGFPNFLTDDELASMLSTPEYDDKNKWVILDTCHSGGFWGNGDESTGFDLSQVPNTSLLAAAAENDTTPVNPFGLSYMTQGFIDGIDVGIFNWSADADANGDGIVNLSEIAGYIDEWYDDLWFGNPDPVEVFLKDTYLGQTEILSPDSFHVSYTSNNNNDTWLPTSSNGNSTTTPNAVPEPPVWGLFLLGLLALFRHPHRSVTSLNKLGGTI